MKHIKTINIIIIFCGGLLLAWRIHMSLNNGEVNRLEMDFTQNFFNVWLPYATVCTLYALLAVNIFSWILKDIKNMEAFYGKKARPLIVMILLAFLLFNQVDFKIDIPFVFLQEPLSDKMIALAFFALFYRYSRKFLKEQVLQLVK